LIDMI